MRFKQYNANPSDKRTTDCTRRALSLAYNIPYNDVKKELNGIRDELGKSAYNYAVVTDEYISRKGSEELEIGSKVSVKDFCDNHLVGTYLLDVSEDDLMNRHLTCVIDGTIYDTWDCSEYVVLHAYIVNDGASDIDFNIQDYRGFVKQLTQGTLEQMLPGKNIFVNAFRNSDETTIPVKVTVDYRKNFQFILKVPYRVDNPEEYITKVVKKKCKEISLKTL